MTVQELDEREKEILAMPKGPQKELAWWALCEARQILFTAALNKLSAIMECERLGLS